MPDLSAVWNPIPLWGRTQVTTLTFDVASTTPVDYVDEALVFLRCSV